jgi:hypothetical protein
MAGLDPAIHVLPVHTEVADGRIKSGHDDIEGYEACWFYSMYWRTSSMLPNTVTVLSSTITMRP